jgi:hypothetical protein
MVVAYALAKVKTKGAGFLLRIKYAGENTWWADLEYALYSRVIHIATKNKWKTPKPYIGKEPLRRACKLAIWEKIHPHVCPTCLGRAQALIDDKLVVCQPCNGTSRIFPTNQYRLDLLHIGDDWPEFITLYNRITNILQGWEMDGLSRMAKALYSR